MSTVKGLRAGVTAGILAGVALMTGPFSARVSAQTQFSTEVPGSILIFPKVVNTTPDTIIQVTNTSNSQVYAHCFYVDGRSVNGQPLWTVTDFELALTRQQPTHWSARDGRAVNPFDGTQGLDPGLVPPVSQGFSGFLVCVETLSDGTPVNSNALKGEATVGVIEGPGGLNQVSKYNAIMIPGLQPDPMSCPGCGNNGDDILKLDGVEYAACPRDLLMNFQAEGSSDPAIDGVFNAPSIVSSNLTLVPCGMDFQNLIPSSTSLAVSIRNEFEINSSTSSAIPVDCWFSGSLGQTVPFGGSFDVGTLQSDFGTSILSPQAPSDLPGLGVINVLRTAGDGTSDTAASNLFWPAGGATVDSEIRLPGVP